jgi:hypothetical protein
MALGLAHQYEFRYHQHFGEYETPALLGAWKAACTFHSLGDGGVDENGVPLGLFRWGRLKVTGAIIEWARDEMRQHGMSKTGTRFETLSLDMPWDNDGERTLGETLLDSRSERGYQQVEDHEVLLALRERLTPKEWDILTRYADGQTLKSIGEDVYGVSESRVCQLMAKITAKARRILAGMEPESEVRVPVLTPLEREEAAEEVWLDVLAAGEAREEQRIAKNRARYAARLAREA